MQVHTFARVNLKKYAESLSEDHCRKPTKVTYVRQNLGIKIFHNVKS